MPFPLPALFNKKSKPLLYIFFLTLNLQLATLNSYSQYGFGTNQPSDSSVIHIVSPDSSQGVILPFVTNSTRPGAAANIRGMIVYNADDSCIQVCNGVQWNCISEQDSLFTQGSVIFADSLGRLSEDNDNFYWDNTNKSLLVSSYGNPLSRTDPFMLYSNTSGGGGGQNFIWSWGRGLVSHTSYNGNEGTMHIIRDARGGDIANSTKVQVNDQNGIYRTYSKHTDGGDVGSSSAITYQNNSIIRGFTPVNSFAYADQRFYVRHYNEEGAFLYSRNPDLALMNTGALFLGYYGAGTKKASDLSKTESNYLTGFATDGTILEINKDTLIAEVTDSILNDSLFTPGSVIFAGDDGSLDQNNPNFLWDNSNSQLNIFNPTNYSPFFPTDQSSGNRFTINDTSFDASFTVGGASLLAQRVTNGTGLPQMQLLRARGSQSSLGQTAINDLAGVFRWQMYGAAGFWPTADITFKKTNETAGGRVIGNIEFYLRSSSYELGNPYSTSNNLVLSLEHNRSAILHAYGLGTKEAADISVTESNYLTGFATDGTILEINKDTLISEVTDSILNDSLFTPGSVIFAGEDGSFSESNNSFHWVDSISSLGIRKIPTTTNYALDINGSVRINGDYVIDNGPNTTQIRNNGNFMSNGFTVINTNVALQYVAWGSTAGNGGLNTHYWHIGGSGTANREMSLNSTGLFIGGNTTATNKLHVVDSAGDPVRLYGLQNDASLDTVVTVDPSGVLHKTAAADLVAASDADWVLDADTLYSGPDSIMVIKGGQVGIGTINPTYALDIQTSNGVRILNGGIQHGPVSGYIMGYHSGHKSLILRTPAATVADSGWVMQRHGGPNNKLWFGDDGTSSMIVGGHNLRLMGANGGVNPTVPLTNYVEVTAAGALHTTGNIGAGNSSPTNRLHVTAASDPIKLEGLQNDITLDTVIMTDASGILHKRALSSIADSINDNDWVLNGDTLYSGPDSTVVIKGGNVGIGSSNPGSRLDVNGDINTVAGVMRFRRDQNTVYLWNESNNILRAQLGTFNGTLGYFRVRGANGDDVIGMGAGLDTAFIFTGSGQSLALHAGAPSNAYTNPHLLLKNTGQLQLTRYGGGTFNNTDDIGLLSYNSNGIVNEMTFSEVADSLNILIDDNDWVVDADTLYSAPDSTVVIKSGKVGVGTLTPTAKFEIIGDSASSSAYSIIVQDSSGSSNSFMVRDDGRVSIGRTPSGRGILSISGSHQTLPSGNGQLAVFSNDSVSQDKGGQIVLGGAINSSDLTRTFALVAGLKENATLNNRAGYLQFGTRSGVGGSSDIFERMRITSEGKVGIGTTTPNSQMQLSGTINDNTIGGWTRSITIDSRSEDATGFSGMYVQPIAGATTTNLAGMVLEPQTDTLPITVTNVYSAYIANLTKGTGSNVTNQYGVYLENLNRGDNNWAIYSSGGTQSYFGGNVGIGTTSPAANLHVVKNGLGTSAIFEGNQNDGGENSIQVGAIPNSTANIAVLGHHAVSSSHNDYGYLELYNGTRALTWHYNGNIGIATTSPLNRLHVSATIDPIRLEGLQNDATLDTVVTVDVNGVLHKTAATDIPASNSAFTSVAANYTATTSDEVIFVDASSGNVTITLPTASGNTGKKYRIKKFEASANNVILDGDGVETIDGSATQTTNVPWTGWVIISNGSNWGVIGRF